MIKQLYDKYIVKAMMINYLYRSELAGTDVSAFVANSFDDIKEKTFKELEDMPATVGSKMPLFDKDHILKLAETMVDEYLNESYQNLRPENYVALRFEDLIEDIFG
ncbi:hypothetical protein GF382_01005 [Candidatus Falkowbacteria bacterium]|nr:hypothetical protein [Candidatus Falkowbacteria bacterium]